jgi:hypothetical protein
MRLPEKTLLAIAGGLSIGAGLRILYELYKFQIETINQMLATKNAYDIMMMRVNSGLYVGKTTEEVQKDFEFYRMAARLQKD